MIIKALSLWQPWASAIALGSKRIETRGWSTRYRGPIAIHAAKRCHQGELIALHSCWNWRGALWPLSARMGDRKFLWDVLPFGAVVAVAQLVDCRPTDSFTVGELDTTRVPEGEKGLTYAWSERQMGDFSPGRTWWILHNVRALPSPIPAQGSQILWDWEVPAEVEPLIEELT